MSESEGLLAKEKVGGAKSPSERPSVLAHDEHKFDSDNANARCWKCGMRRNYYQDILRASKEQPERKDLKEWLKCKPRK